MSYCPLISYQKRYEERRECMGEECVLYSRNKNECLIRMALLKYSQNTLTENTPSIEDRVRELEHQIGMVSFGFPTYPIGPDGPGLSRRL